MNYNINFFESNEQNIYLIPMMPWNEGQWENFILFKWQI